MLQTLAHLYTATTADDRPAFGEKVDGDWIWTSYADFQKRVESAIGFLVDQEINKGDTVAIIANNSMQWAAVAFATWRIGAVLCPLYEAQRVDDWKFIVEDADAKIIILRSTALRDRLDFDIPTALLGDVDSESIDVSNLAYPEPDDLAEIIYTSGTTGTPKGVELTHRNITTTVNSVSSLLDIRADDRSLSFLPWAHSFGQIMELCVLYSRGAGIAIAEGFQTIPENLTEVQPTLLFSVPRVFHRVYDGVQKRIASESGFKRKLFKAAMSDNRGLFAWVGHAVGDKLLLSEIRQRFGGKLRYAFCGGAALSVDVARFMDQLGIEIYEGYGLTETAPLATANRPDAKRLGSVGKPIPGVELKLLSTEEYDGVSVGEVAIKGANVMRGYRNRDVETAEVIQDGWFHSGDLGRIDADGYLWILGRAKAQYKLQNGKFVAPEPLELLLQESPYVSQVLIVGEGRANTVALVVLDDAYSADATKNTAEMKAQILKDFSSRMPTIEDFKRPKYVIFCREPFTETNGLATPSMKLKRRAIAKHYETEINDVFGT